MYILELLKQRRVWASIAALIVILLPVLGYTTEFSPTAFTESILQIVEGVSALAAVALPIWSYFKPKIK